MNKKFEKAVSRHAQILEKHRQMAVRERDPNKRQKHEQHHASRLKKLIRLIGQRYGSDVVVTLHLILHDLYSDQDGYYDRIMRTI